MGRDALLEAESQSYHGAGTCTFYGTANSNQMLMEMMGLHLPGTAFVNPNTPLRDALTARRRRRALRDHRAWATTTRRSARCVDEKAIVNGIVGLHGHRRLDQPHDPPRRHGAGGRASLIDWDDFDDLSAVDAAAGARSIPTARPT